MFTFQRGLQIRIAMCSMIYDKVNKGKFRSFFMSNHYFNKLKAIGMRKSSIINSSNGKIINLLSFDVYRFDTVVSLVHHLWKGPLEIFVFSYFLYKEIGHYGWIGVILIICFVPIQSEFNSFSFKTKFVFILL